MVVFDLPGDVAGIGEGGAAIPRHAADMVAMHMGQDHDIDLIGAVARTLKRGGDAFGCKAGVEKDQFGAGVDEGRGEEELRDIGRQMGGAGGFRKGRVIGVQTEDRVRVGDGAGSGQKGRDLEIAVLEAAETGGGHAHHVGLRNGRSCGKGHEGGGGPGKKGVAAGQFRT